MLQEMPLHVSASLMLPVLRQKVDEVDHTPGALAMVDEIAVACGLVVPGYAVQQAGAPGTKRQHRSLVAALKAMSLRLLTVAVGSNLGRHHPRLEQLAQELLERMRDTVTGPRPRRVDHM